MGKSWTEEQLEAIKTTGCDLLVSAAAGAGKTAVLVERIIRKITDEKDPLDVDKLLIVTFTKAAAAEMRERIAAAISEELNKNPGSRHLNRQLVLLNRASITTLHSFCLDVIRQYFYRIDLDPAFKVADDTEAALLRLEVLEELFDALYAADNKEFLTLVDAYGGEQDDSQLQEIVLRLYEFAMSNPWPEEWLNSMVRWYRVSEGFPLEKHPWGETLLEWLSLQFNSYRSRLEQALEMTARTGGPYVYRENIIDDIGLVDDVIRAFSISWNETYNVINNLKFKKLKQCRDNTVDDALKEMVKKIRDNVKKQFSDIKSVFFSRHPDDILEDIKKVAPFIQSLCKVVIEFTNQYKTAKASKGIVDFSDLEHYCLKILLDESAVPEKPVPSLAAYDLREQFEEVLVDEYQDINGVQETILKLVSRFGTGTPNRFMVGDVKQSIYRFRLADPTLFKDKYRNYSTNRDMHEQRIDLTKNFRSRREIINAVNFIFRQIMTERVGELTYDEKAELASGACYPSEPNDISHAAGPAEVYILEKKQETGLETEADEQEIVELDAVQKEARLVAGRIRDMVLGTKDNPGPEFYIYDSKLSNYRPVQYGDIVVLLRTTRNVANVFIEEFRLAGIPAYADLGTGYFQAVEIETMLSLLKVIDNPRQDIPLAAVLRSPIVGLNAEELASVRLRDAGGDFYDAVLKSAQLTESDVDLKLASFLKNLEQWRTLARRGPLSELIWRIYNETGYYAIVGAMPAGAQRQANLRALYDRARMFESTSFRGLFRFLRFVEKFQETGNDLGAAKAVGEGEDVVRVISIHKSKGLEFPVVFVSGLGKQFNTSDLRTKAVFHKKLGIGLPVVDVNLRFFYPSLAQQAIQKKLQLELLAEEMRVLYVALTRAKEKLILTGSVNKRAKALVTWCENTGHKTWPLPDSALVTAKSYLDWICPALARHKDGETLRKLAGCAIEPQEFISGDPSRWTVFLPEDDQITSLDSQEHTEQEKYLELVQRAQPINQSQRYKEEFSRVLNWKYPFQNAVGIPAKASVTEIKRRFVDDAQEEVNPFADKPVFKRPMFLQQNTGLSPAEFGTVMHLVMQNLNFDECLKEDGIQNQVNLLVLKELLTPDQAEAVDVKAIEGFIKSSLGQRVLSAYSVKREIPFTMALPAEQVYEGLGSCEERVMVQGVIDCLLDEGDGYVLIDYKTDKVKSGQMDVLINKYQGQLSLYQMAVEKILKKPVKEKYLYLFSIGKEIKVR